MIKSGMRSKSNQPSATARAAAGLEWIIRAKGRPTTLCNERRRRRLGNVGTGGVRMDTGVEGT